MALRMNYSLSTVFPVYNEEKNIEELVRQTTEFLDTLTDEWEIVLINDGSRDRSCELINKLANADGRIVAIHHSVNQGYGAALKSGIQKASKELIFFCDSDLQFHMNELLLFVPWIEQHDLVIGYRANRQDPFHRRLNAMAWNLLVRLVVGLRVKDIDCAFKIFHSYIFEVVEIDAIGAMVNTDILVQVKRMGFSVKEIPVTHFPRMEGEQTGANPKVILKAFKELFLLYHKLKNISKIIHHERRQRKTNIRNENGRRGERRKRFLPINFPSRRRRYIKTQNMKIPISGYDNLKKVSE